MGVCSLVKYYKVIFYTLGFILSWHLSCAQKYNEIQIIEKSLDSHIDDWICNMLNSNNGFGGNLQSRLEGKERKILHNNNVQICIVTENRIIKSIAVTPIDNNIYTKIKKQLGTWNKNESGYFVNDKTCFIIDATPVPYFVFYNKQHTEEQQSSLQLNSTIASIENILLRKAKIPEAGLVIKQSPHLGYPVYMEDLFQLDASGVMAFVYKSNSALITVMSHLDIEFCLVVSIAFYDDILYDKFMRDVHLYYKYNNGKYEHNGIYCTSQKNMGVNVLTFSCLE